MLINGIDVPDATAEVATSLSTVAVEGGRLMIAPVAAVRGVTIPGWGPIGEPDEPPPVSDFGELLFDDDFTAMSDLRGLDTKQVTGGGEEPALFSAGLSTQCLECAAPEGGKSEIGHTLKRPLQRGDIFTSDAVFCIVQAGDSECFLEDIESTRADGGGESEPGPRLRRKNKGLAIEQQKAGGENISPPTPAILPGIWYWRRWRCLYQPDGWHELWFAEVGQPLRQIIDWEGDAGGPGTQLGRNRFGVTAAGRGAGFCRVRIRRQTMWVKRAS